MMLATLTVLADFGLVVLIWIVQLIIYPSFHVVSKSDFTAWHKKYMSLISYLVVPLMFAQVVFHAVGLYLDASALKIVTALFIAGAWVTTFTLSVPCHHALASEGQSTAVIRRLIRTNWLRTICWSIVFVLSLIGLNV